MKISIEDAIRHYWLVSNALRHPDSPINMNTGEALDMVGIGDYVRPDEFGHRVKTHLHILKFDIVQGHTKWRHDPEAPTVSARIYKLIQPTEKLTSMANS